MSVISDCHKNQSATGIELPLSVVPAAVPGDAESAVILTPVGLK